MYALAITPEMNPNSGESLLEFKVNLNPPDNEILANKIIIIARIDFIKSSATPFNKYNPNGIPRTLAMIIGPASPSLASLLFFAKINSDVVPATKATRGVAVFISTRKDSKGIAINPNPNPKVELMDVARNNMAKTCNIKGFI